MLSPGGNPHEIRLPLGKAEAVRYDRVAETYQEGRGAVARAEAWGAAIDLPNTGQLRVLDVGAGTGIFTRAWPRWGASLVVGVDPSLSMLVETKRVGLPSQARILLGSAEHIPLASRTFDIAWLSTVIHHIADREACAREIARLVVPGGRVYVRGFFADRSHMDWLSYFPGAERAIARFPSSTEIVELFVRRGFSLMGIGEMREPERPLVEVRSWIVKMRRADTLLTTFTDEEATQGLVALDAADPPTLGGSLHLLTLERNEAQ